MQAVENLLGKIVTPQCAKTILAFDFSSLDCYKLAISKGLSIGIVGGAVLVKVPQIINILASGSVFGLSLMSILLESIAIAISLAYNFRLGNPFSTYGEGCFIMIQNVIIIALILSHNRNYPVSFGLSVAGYAFAYSLLHEHIVSASLINTLQYGTIFIGIGSKLPQIYGNFAAKSTGQLSIITTFLQFAGTVARVLTTLQEVPDPALIASFVVASVLNGVILLQIILYGKKKAKYDEKKNL